MKRTNVVVNIQTNGEYCRSNVGECDHTWYRYGHFECDLFNGCTDDYIRVRRDETGNPRRCRQCIAAEKKAKVLKG